MSLNPQTKINLAPMEGVIDAEMRGVFTSLGGYDRCVTEFIRVTEQKIPNHVLFRFSPELQQGGLTDSGVPVYIQLLGGSPKWMAINAASVAELSPPGIDLNFGCPSKTVNRHDGGSALLREPKRVGEIVSAVRDAVDPTIPITAKIRLGFSHSDDLEAIVDSVLNAGADELCIHARTKKDGYKPPPHWQEVQRVASKAKSANTPLTINGDVWCADSATQALIASDAQHLMLGRGALRKPDLAAQIKAKCNNQTYEPRLWPAILDIVLVYLKRTQNRHPHFVGNRAKQWLGFLKVNYLDAEIAFQLIKKMKDADTVLRALEEHLAQLT